MKARSMMITAAVLTLLICAGGSEGAATDDAVPLQPTKDDSAERTAAAKPDCQRLLFFHRSKAENLLGTGERYRGRTVQIRV
jgi:hypothetical protein